METQKEKFRMLPGNIQGEALPRNSPLVNMCWAKGWHGGELSVGGTQ
jgi:hypothetical protein